MDKQPELEAKYQRLATEYSKVRSQATVLKKAVLEEQAKSNELKEAIRKHEQTIRKHDQEMESLTFRNEQLTKRISVLQQELQVNSHGKKGKHKPPEVSSGVDVGILDEEFQKKILENAQLLSSLSDKELEISRSQERIEWLEEKVANLEKEVGMRDQINRIRMEKLEKENEALHSQIKEIKSAEQDKHNSLHESDEKVLLWKAEVEELKTKCDMLRNKPTTNQKLTDYYESQLTDMLESKTIAVAETKSLLAENLVLKARLENMVYEHIEVQKKLDSSNEELVTTSDNYRSQLDALTEHLAAQNEKIAMQCEEVQVLKFKLAGKK